MPSREFRQYLRASPRDDPIVWRTDLHSVGNPSKMWTPIDSSVTFIINAFQKPEKQASEGNIYTERGISSLVALISLYAIQRNLSVL